MTSFDLWTLWLSSAPVSLFTHSLQSVYKVCVQAYTSILCIFAVFGERYRVRGLVCYCKVLVLK